MGIHFGYPLPITRADADYYPLMVANSFLGEHRTFNGRLMNELRGERGLNYGDYSYIEYWDSAAVHQQPDPAACRAASSTSRCGSGRWCRRTPSSPCAPASTRSSGCATRG